MSVRRFFHLTLWICFLHLTPALSDEVALWTSLDAEVEGAIAQGQASGATLLVGQGDRILYFQTYGVADVESAQPLTKDHLFDAASLTKPLVTALAIHMLAQDGRLELDDPVTDYLPMALEKSPTIAELLTHHSGLPAGLPESDLPDSLYQAKLTQAPGRRFVYSDVGYMLLGRVVEKVSGLPLDQFFRQRIAEPLGMKESTFRPVSPLVVPTYGVERGRVHDPSARALGGVAGHAGLFTTAHEVHQELAGLSKLLKPKNLKRLFQQEQGGRSLGMDMESRFSSARGSRFSPLQSGGHTGFTGTSFWWDWQTGLHLILMTSRLHPDNSGDVIPLRAKLATLVGDHFLGAQVHTGLDRLSAQRFEVLQGKRVGFLVNQTSRDRFGRHLLDLLPTETPLKVKALFTPEHGLKGVRDEKIEHGHHRELDVPVLSLYGETRKPKREWFKDLDVLVFDLQDVGVRYYTYISTLKACLEVAQVTGTEVLVLDRPNPLGGVTVDGHIARQLSFIACDTIPTVHGLTMGEMAQFLNRKIAAKLTVVKMEGWEREMRWSDTGLPLLTPSPNLAELESIELYPILGQIEWCQVSVGRGTRSPFRILGAPYITDPQALATHLNREFSPALRFRPRFFRPQSSVFEDELCGGVEVCLPSPLDNPAQAGLKLAQLLKARYPDNFKLSKMKQHLGRNDLPQLFMNPPDRKAWLSERAPFLLYP